MFPYGNSFEDALVAVGATPNQKLVSSGRAEREPHPVRVYTGDGDRGDDDGLRPDDGDAVDEQRADGGDDGSGALGGGRRRRDERSNFEGQVGQRLVEGRVGQLDEDVHLLADVDAHFAGLPVVAAQPVHDDAWNHGKGENVTLYGP